MHDLLNPNYIAYTQCAHHRSAKKLQKKVEYREETKEDSVYKRCQEITKLKIDNNSTSTFNIQQLNFTILLHCVYALRAAQAQLITFSQCFRVKWDIESEKEGQEARN